MLEEENLDMKKKMTEWLKVNQRLLNIFEEMKDREVEMIFVAERYKQQNAKLRVFLIQSVINQPITLSKIAVSLLVYESISLIN